MEGILAPLPWTAPRRTLQVPYLAYPQFQPTGTLFEDFPQQNGVHRTDNAGNLVSSLQDITSLAAFLQSWLFFGLLSAFLEHEISRVDFVRGGFIDINQEAAHGYFREWRRMLSHLSYTQQKSKRERIRKLVQKASSKSGVFEEAADYLASKDELFDLVSLSAKLLISHLSAIADDTFLIINPRSSGLLASWASALVPRLIPRFTWAAESIGVPSEYFSENLASMGEHDARKLLNEQPNIVRPFPPGVENGGRAAKRLLKAFTDNDWCPYRSLVLCRTYDYRVLNLLASLLNLQGAGEDHRQCLASNRCRAHDLIVEGPSPYPFLHGRNDCQGCPLFEVLGEEIAPIIECGQIPLISMNLEGDLDPHVVKCTPYTTYTAISHVWSDGLGNPSANALPRCQLERLRTIISETYHAKYNPFYDGSTMSSQARSAATWEFWRATRTSKPYYKIDKKRVFFWMDTLCIPVSSPSEPAEVTAGLKLRAMKHITPIFTGAFTTLILDNGLQSIPLRDCGQVSGDEFAAMVLTSKWMQRGWTLEEGALSSTCVFRMMGKPYEISGSLNHLLPELEPRQSPLDRASINVRRMMPRLLRIALLDEKKKLSNDPMSSRSSRVAKLLRIPQFTWTWNSLLDRATTKSEDGPIILANLLDFNVSALKSVKQEDRLKLLIQNCDELPLSLLYNTGPRIYVKEHPELGWIPQSISGDHIVPGAALRRTKVKNTERQVRCFIDRTDTDPDSFMVLDVLSSRRIPYDVGAYLVRAQRDISGRNKQDYIVEVRRRLWDDPADEDSRRIERHLYEHALGTCIVVDETCGSSSRHGFVARGVQFCVEAYKSKGMVLRYDAPIVVWEPEQWQQRYDRPSESLPRFETAHVRRSQRLILHYDPSLWSQRLHRRPLLTQHPLSAKITGTIIFLTILLAVLLALGYLFVTVRDALGFRPGPSMHSFIIVWIFGPLCAMFIYDPIRRRIGMYTYIAWLKSFDDDFVRTESQGDKRFRRLKSVFFECAWWPWNHRSRNAASQDSMSLPLVHQHGRTETEPAEGNLLD